MKLTVIGTPKALKRHRHTKKGFTYDPSFQDKKQFSLQANIMKPDRPLEGALKVNLKFYFQRPKNHYRSGKFSKLLKPNISGNYKTNKPDLDNLVKLVLDSLQGCGFYRDDSQVVSIVADKYYCELSEEPRTEINISFLN